MKQSNWSFRSDGQTKEDLSESEAWSLLIQAHDGELLRGGVVVANRRTRSPMRPLTR